MIRQEIRTYLLFNFFFNTHLLTLLLKQGLHLWFEDITRRQCMSVMAILATIRTNPEPAILLLLHSFQEMLAHLHQVATNVQWPSIAISFMRIEKSRFSQWRRNSKVNTSSGSHRKNQTRGDKKQTKNENAYRYEQKCQSHTCSGTINSSMYDSDWTITTSPLTSSAPYSG